MTTLLIASAILAPQSTTFFPLESGNTWDYLISVTSSVVRVRQVQKALPSQAYEGSPATPLEIYLDGKIDSTCYYRVIDGFVCLVGVSGGTPMPEPAKVLPVVPKKGQKWSASGQSLMLGMVVPSKSESKVIADEPRDVFGKQVRCITIETKGELGEGDTSFNTLSTEVYAEGIGLVSRRQESTPGKNTKRKSIAITTLVKHDKAAG
jgi:hypothetical protein